MMMFDQNYTISTMRNHSYAAKKFDIFWTNRAILARKGSKV
jgi:hypothetical protein